MYRLALTRVIRLQNTQAYLCRKAHPAMREGECFSLQSQQASSPLAHSELRPPPVWRQQQPAAADGPVADLSMTLLRRTAPRPGGRHKRGLLATFQQKQQHKLAEYTLQEAERALESKDFEVAFELFTRVLLRSAIAAESGGVMPGAAAIHSEAQVGAQRARLGLVAAAGATGEQFSDESASYRVLSTRDGGSSLSLSPRAVPGDDVELLLAKADERSGCNVSFASPPVDYPESPPADSPAAPALYRDVETEASRDPAAAATTTAPVKFSQQRPSRRRELSFPTAVAATPSHAAPHVPQKQTEEVEEMEQPDQVQQLERADNSQRQVTVLSTPRTQLALLQSLDNYMSSLSNSFLSTRCWRTAAGEEVILRHFPTRCDISLDGGRSWRSRGHSCVHFFLTPSQPIVLPLSLMPAVEPQDDVANHSQPSRRKQLQPQRAAIRIRRSRSGAGSRDYSLARWNASPGTSRSGGSTEEALETVVLPVLVGQAGHSSATSVSRSGTFQHFVPHVLSAEVRSFSVLEDRVYGKSRRSDLSSACPALSAIRQQCCRLS